MKLRDKKHYKKNLVVLCFICFYFFIFSSLKNFYSKIKQIKTGKQSETMYCSECKDYTTNFRPQKVEMTNKVLLKDFLKSTFK